MSDLFWKRVNNNGPDTCWGWSGSMVWNGYGCLAVSGKYWRAHRYSWFLHNGPIPDGMVVMHTCDNRACTNPCHLQVGTQGDNVRDQMRKGRRLEGENHGRAKLSAAQVLAMRQSNKPHVYFARKYGLHPTSIARARNGERWAHLTRKEIKEGDSDG